MEKTLTAKPRLGISACLLGHKVRHDGAHKRDEFLTDSLGRFVEWVPICPEVEVGMGVPRESVRLLGSPGSPRMIGAKSATDWSAVMHRFAQIRLDELAAMKLSGYVFKKGSPSCGMERVPVYQSNSMLGRSGSGRGLFAAAVIRRWAELPVEEEGRLNDLKLRDNFVERIFAYHRWQQTSSERKSAGALVRYHTGHKFLLLAHSQTHYRRLGRLVAAARKRPLAAVYEDYGGLFMEALARRATARSHANVLDHMMGYFSAQLTGLERRELVQLIAEYRRGLVPLVAALTLVRHYVEKYRVEYLRGQLYLTPAPTELMLRNHV
jgi:uncharacterized protein YbgA (DUF1722 family)/uncharacterized protein YbbK (DUF523 family)